MPLVSVTFTIVDGKDQESTVTLYTTDGFTLAQLIGAATIVAPLVKGLINGGIKGCSLVIDVDLTGIVGIGTADPDSDTEEGALFIFGTDGGHDKRNRIPTFDEANLISATREVNLSDIQVAAFTNAMIAGVVTGGATVTFVDSREEDLDSVDDAYESFQSSRRRR